MLTVLLLLLLVVFVIFSCFFLSTCGSFANVFCLVHEYATVHDL